MNEIYCIYRNDIGIAFQWKTDLAKNNSKKLQIVFRDMGFYLLPEEVSDFYNCVCSAREFERCAGCSHNKEYRSILLRTPANQVDLAVNTYELQQIEDLIEGTLFQLRLDSYLNQLCGN
ncbi:hypothetical protein [Sinomicrobium weinanense]|uniref:Uncharacterized protein n=1 Tax=Sinomicrobium weinanense TaxID=2842200 RepID=A0A926JSK4_9FLAO|nr:hypothetical protein [Sinomicrobium weinanense]MBC9796740.1 hypothetical protein [Sinomicrobium weinanense]MBU3124011.1 hypothetical protein [Sinomicrobium weinanense]